MSEKWLFAGLGNPGRKYQNNRHNVGFLLLDSLLERASSSASNSWKNIEGAQSAQIRTDSDELFLIKPQEFMNNSGRAISAFMKFRSIAPNNLVVIHDEVEIPFAKMRVKMGGGHAGHNGIKSTVEHLGTEDFFRLRLGVGRPEHPDFALADWVLSDFLREEQLVLNDFLLKGCQCLDSLRLEGLAKAQGRYNS